ncbi:MAG: M36 family metallopeptidase [Acidobacteria bacterium]|nr:M36 family metallopeptidase [Acidobacteriota bacterium]
MAPAPAGSYAIAQQFVRERPIYGTSLALHRNENKVAYAVTGNLAPASIEPRPEPKKIKAKEAASVVAQELETDVSKLKCSCEETWLPIENELSPCFHVKATCFDPFGDWYGFVSFGGELLALFNVASAASATTKGYQINPTRTPELEALTLNALGSPNVLSGSRTTIWGPNQTQTQGQKGAFDFPPTDEEFDEPQLYYFLEFCRDQGAGIGKNFLNRFFAAAGFNPMNGTVHYGGALDNAFYSPNTGQLYFGDSSDGATYSSRSLDIVLHEFGHAISDTICHLGRARKNDQSRAMSEGYSDYLAATILGNPVIGDDFMPAYARTCANTSKFPSGFVGEEHAVGTVWAGFLWDLRNEPTIGQTGADLIVLQSLTFLGPWKTILQGLEALVQADRALFPGPGGKGGTHEDRIRAAFKARQR